MSTVQKQARNVVPGDRLVFSNLRAGKTWHERVVKVVFAPTQGAVLICTRRDGETLAELRCDPMDVLEVVE